MKKILISGLIVLMMTPFSLFVVAQDNFDCGNLETDDCTTLQDALANMAALDGVNNDSFSLEIFGAGGGSEGNSLTLTGSGPVIFGDEGISAFRYDVEGNQNEDASQSGSLMWLDGMFYLGEADADGNLAWSGLATDTEEGELFMDIYSGNLVISSLADTNAVVLQRGEDAERDGQKMIVFEGDILIEEFLVAESTLELLEVALGALGGADPLGNQMGGDFDLAGAVPLLAMLLTRDEVGVNVWVGADDGYIHRVELTADIALNASIADPSLGEISATINFSTDLGGFEDDITLEAPTDFEAREDYGIDLDALIETVGVGGGADAAPVDNAERFAPEATLAYGESVTGTLEAGNTEDTWAFEASAGDVVTITMSAADDSSSLDTQIYLRDPAGEELAFNDDHFGAEGLGIFDSQIADFEIPADGEYRIVATWLTETRDGDYKLSVVAD